MTNRLGIAVFLWAALPDAAGAWRVDREALKAAIDRIVPVYQGGQQAGFEVVAVGMVLTPRIVPAYRDARLVGWKFVGVGTESTAARLGFLSSDVIVAIDGRAVVDVADVVELKEEILAEAGPHQVEVERRGVRRMVEWWW